MVRTGTRRGPVRRGQARQPGDSAALLDHGADPNALVFTSAVPYSVQTGEPAFARVHVMPFYGFLDTHPEPAMQFQAAMSAYSRLEAAAIAEAYDFAGDSTVVDVGGGNGIRLYRDARARHEIAAQHPRVHDELTRPDSRRRRLAPAAP
jgi:hypothetical protein